MIFISLAWGQKHRILAHRLAASAERFGVEIHVRALPGEAPSRQHAWALRPDLILEALGKTSGPVIMIDADAVMQRPPDELAAAAADPSADFAAVPDPRRGWRLGVLVVRPTETARQVLERFGARLSSGEPYENDEPIFRDVVDEFGASVVDLSPECNWCELWNDRGAHGNRAPVVEVNA